MKVAGYCRVSTDKEDQVNSFQAQQRFFREYISRHQEWELYEIYADEGITGTSTRKRTQFNRMIRDAHAGAFQLIITKEISRFSRNILDTVQYTRELKRIGVGVLFLTENLNTLQPETEMLMTFMGTIAQEESRRTSVRVKWGQTRQMERGVVFGHSLLGYDVENGEIKVNPEGAALVQLIFHKYGVEKKGTRAICAELQAAGYCTSTGNSQWNPSHILKILKNEKYVGDLVQKKTITPDYLSHAKKINHGEEALVIIHNHHEPIVSRELWTLVREEMTKRRTKQNPGVAHSRRYAFSGKIKCGECGANFISRSKKLKDGRKIRRWQCHTTATQGCACCDVGKQLRDEDGYLIFKTAIQHLPINTASLIAEVTQAAVLASAAGEESGADNASRLRQKLSQTEAKKICSMDAYFSGCISKEEMLTMKARYDRELERISRKIQETVAIQTENLEDKIRSELSSLLSGECISQALCKHLLDHITVYKDHRIVLKLKHMSQHFVFTE